VRYHLTPQNTYKKISLLHWQAGSSLPLVPLGKPYSKKKKKKKKTIKVQEKVKKKESGAKRNAAALWPYW